MSFDIALSGIQAINQQLDTISNNIANAGTYGFKSSRANFASMYAGDQPTGTQIGSVSQSIGLNGGVLNTGRTLDASINGRGFFVVKDSTGIENYTRVGIFNKNASDLLADSNGRLVQGFKLTPPSTTPGPLGNIAVPTNLLGAKQTTGIDFVANLSPDWTPPTVAWVPPDATAVPPVLADPASYNMSKVSLVFDSLGREHTVTQFFALDGAAANTVNVYVSVDGTDISTFGGGGTFGAAGAPVKLVFTAAGQLSTVDGGATPLSVPLGFNPSTAISTANPLAITLDYTGTTLQKGEVTTSTNASDGYSAGSYVGVELQDDGSVLAKYSNGQKQAVAIIAMATFPDEEALTAVDNTSWTANNNSGTPNLSTPGAGVAGTLSTASLEQSNVDITSELVGLMTSQRNYQANSKVITTENQMLQSLMQAL
jgi:flagellar hook protein FlgE